MVLWNLKVDGEVYTNLDYSKLYHKLAGLIGRYGRFVVRNFRYGKGGYVAHGEYYFPKYGVTAVVDMVEEKPKRRAPIRILPPVPRPIQPVKPTRPRRRKQPTRPKRRIPKRRVTPQPTPKPRGEVRIQPITVPAPAKPKKVVKPIKPPAPVVKLPQYTPGVINILKEYTYPEIREYLPVPSRYSDRRFVVIGRSRSGARSAVTMWIVNTGNYLSVWNPHNVPVVGPHVDPSEFLANRYRWKEYYFGGIKEFEDNLKNKRPENEVEALNILKYFTERWCDSVRKAGYGNYYYLLVQNLALKYVRSYRIPIQTNIPTRSCEGTLRLINEALSHYR